MRMKMWDIFQERSCVCFAFVTFISLPQKVVCEYSMHAVYQRNCAESANLHVWHIEIKPLLEISIVSILNVYWSGWKWRTNYTRDVASMWKNPACGIL